MPSLAGSYFGGALIYLCEHNEEGAMGLIINRPGRLDLSELAKELSLPAPPLGARTLVVEGGPVSPEQGFVLHSGEQMFESSRSVADGIVLSSSADALRALVTPEAPHHAIIALGYAGWGPGQLDGEIEDDAWLTVQASRTVLFETPLEARLKQAAASIGIDMRLMARNTGNA